MQTCRYGTLAVECHSLLNLRSSLWTLVYDSTLIDPVIEVIFIDQKRKANKTEKVSLVKISTQATAKTKRRMKGIIYYRKTKPSILEEYHINVQNGEIYGHFTCRSTQSTKRHCQLEACHKQINEIGRQVVADVVPVENKLLSPSPIHPPQRHIFTYCSSRFFKHQRGLWEAPV